MASKRVPVEVEKAIANARHAKWGVSIRNEKVIITPPDGVAVTMGFDPNDESIKKFRRDCKPYNLIDGPASTPQEREIMVREAEEAGLREADRLNAQRKAQALREEERKQQIKAARQKADAATQQGMNPPQETEMPKKSTASLFPTFDPALLGTRDSSKFLLADDTYYCVECLAQKKEATFKAPQGLTAHRNRWHQLYNESAHTQEISRVSLPADVDTAFDMLRSAMAEALEGISDPQVLAAKDAELAELKATLEKVSKQADADRSDFDKRFLEAQVSADKRLAELLAEGTKESDAKHAVEIEGLMKNFMGILVKIREATETLSPIQAIAKIDTIVSDFLKK